MREFQEQTAGVCVFQLRVNYRCSREVVKLCNGVISEMRERYPIYSRKAEVVGSSQEEGKTGMYTFASMVQGEAEVCELRWVCSEITRILRSRADVFPGDIAILARNVAPIQGYLYRLERELLDLGLKVNMQGTEVSRQEIQLKQDSVSVMSIHQAKGLEWKYVFVTGCATANASSEHSEEEDRLLYVAITRAIREVYLLASNQCLFSRKRGGDYVCDGAFLLPFLSIVESRFRLKCSAEPKKDRCPSKRYSVAEVVREISQTPEIIASKGFPSVVLEQMTAVESPFSAEDEEFAQNEHVTSLVSAVLKRMVFAELVDEKRTVSVEAPDNFLKYYEVIGHALANFGQDLRLFHQTQLVNHVLSASKCKATEVLNDVLSKKTRERIAADMKCVVDHCK
jgi:ATP-dependent exoDNAse (exonuclease V) beta subunit